MLGVSVGVRPRRAAKPSALQQVRVLEVITLPQNVTDRAHHFPLLVKVTHSANDPIDLHLQLGKWHFAGEGSDLLQLHGLV